MACLTKVWSLLCRTQQAPATANQPGKNFVFKVPAEILSAIFIYGSGKELHNVELTCKSFYNLTRNDRVRDEDGQEKFRNNPFWYTVLQLQSPLTLPNKKELNYKGLYSLFIVKCYPMKVTLFSQPWQEIDSVVAESDFHKNATRRCRGISCIAKERVLFKSIVDADVATRKEVLRTIFSVAKSTFPLRTFWDKDGNEMRFCRDCDKLVSSEHGNSIMVGRPNDVRCRERPPSPISFGPV